MTTRSVVQCLHFARTVPREKLSYKGHYDLSSLNEMFKVRKYQPTTTSAEDSIFCSYQRIAFQKRSNSTLLSRSIQIFDDNFFGAYWATSQDLSLNITTVYFSQELCFPIKAITHIVQMRHKEPTQNHARVWPLLACHSSRDMFLHRANFFPAKTTDTTRAVLREDHACVLRKLT